MKLSYVIYYHHFMDNTNFYDILSWIVAIWESILRVVRVISNYILYWIPLQQSMCQWLYPNTTHVIVWEILSLQNEYFFALIYWINFDTHTCKREWEGMKGPLFSFRYIWMSKIVRKWMWNRVKQDQRSQKLTPRESKGNETRSFGVNTKTQKPKGQ